MGTIRIRMIADAPVCGEQKRKGEVLEVPKSTGLDMIGRGEAELIDPVERTVLRGDRSGRYGKSAK